MDSNFAHNWLLKEAENEPLLAFGTFQLGGVFFIGERPSGWQGIDEKLATQAIQYAIERKVNVFDTAGFYGNRQAEQILGRLLEPHNQVRICTKIGQEIRRGRQRQVCNVADLRSQLDNSRKDLRRDVLDLVYLHSPDPEAEETRMGLDFLKEEQLRGRILAIGISVRRFGRQGDPGQEIRWTASMGVDAVQFPLNLLDPVTHTLAKSTLFDSGIAVVARMPFSSGLLARKSFQITAFPSSDHRSQLWPVTRQQEAGRRLALALAAAGLDLSPLPEIAWRFVTSHRPLHAILVGLHRREHVIEALRLSGLPPLSLDNVCSYIKAFEFNA